MKGGVYSVYYVFGTFDAILPATKRKKKIEVVTAVCPSLVCLLHVVFLVRLLMLVMIVLPKAVSCSSNHLG